MASGVELAVVTSRSRVHASFSRETVSRLISTNGLK
jgi:hypothetical protein